MKQHDQQVHGQPFDPGTLAPVPTQTGVFLADVHGGYVLRGTPVSWEVGPYHRVPYVGHAGDGSQAITHPQFTAQQRTEAQQMGLFGVHNTGGANFDTGPMPGDQALAVQDYTIGDFIPNDPLGVLGQLGMGATDYRATVPSPIGRGGRPGW